VYSYSFLSCIASCSRHFRSLACLSLAHADALSLFTVTANSHPFSQIVAAAERKAREFEEVSGFTSVEKTGYAGMTMICRACVNVRVCVIYTLARIPLHTQTHALHAAIRCIYKENV